jgi:hypothetical protein
VQEEQAESESGKRAAKSEDKIGEREECRILSQCYREKKKNEGMTVRKWKE